jgi:hypothetical protein
MRLNATRLGSIASSRSFGDQLDDLAGQVPSLDLNFAQNKSLIDDYSGTTLVTFTRASSGTYVDSQGVIRTAVTNLLLRSEEFSDAAWVQPAIVSANTEIAPNGTLTADTITSGGGANSVYQNVSVLASTIYTASVYVKLGTMSSSDYKVAVYNNSASNFIAADVTPSQTPNSSGWTRVTYTFTTPVGCTSVRWYPFRNGSAIPLSTVYLWGAQLEQSATVGEYIPTTSTINSAPRFDHNPTTGESLGLLVEEARTNSIANNTMVGAVAGTPGTNPTGWFLTASANSISPEIVGTGVEDGITYVDIRYSGTSTGASAFSILASLPAAITAVTGQSWTGSAYVKLQAGSLSNVTNTLQSVNGRSSIGAGLEFTNATYTPTSDSLGVQRRTVSITLANASTERISHTIFNATYASGAAIDITLRIGLPQLEQGAFATSVIPTTSATVTRAADVASITGSNFGVTRTNLLVRSEEFDNASWDPVSGTVTPNAETSPANTLTADKLIAANGGPQGQLAQGVTITSGATVTGSVYAKAGGFDRFELVLLASNNTTPYGRSTFNPNTGVITTAASTANGGTNASSAVQALSNGWYRFSVTVTYPAVTSAGMRLLVTNSDAANGDGVKGVFLWGAQLEVGSAVTPYIQSPSVFTSRASSGTYVGGNGLIQTATTNEARYDHDPISLISKGLLLEEARTNLLLRSEEFDNASWNSSAGARTITPNSVAAPDGLLTADTVAADGTTAPHFVSQSLTLSAVPYAYSVFAKAGTNNFLQLRLFNAFGGMWANFNLATGVVGTVGVTSGAAPTSSIQAYPNGWYRCTMVFTPTATTSSVSAYIVDSASAAGSETNSLSTTLYLWGAQLEAGAFPTSYIPTTTATVTRAADISTSVATSVFESSFYNQTEGTVFTDCSITYTVPGSLFPLVSSLNDGTSNNRIENGFLTSTLAGYEVVASGSAQVGVYPSAVSVLARRLATNYQLNNFAACVNGKSISTDTTGIVPTVSQLRIGDRAGGASTNVLNGTIRRLTYWPTRLGNEVLQRITQ